MGHSEQYADRVFKPYVRFERTTYALGGIGHFVYTLVISHTRKGGSNYHVSPRQTLDQEGLAMLTPREILNCLKFTVLLPLTKMDHLIIISLTKYSLAKEIENE